MSQPLTLRHIGAHGGKAMYFYSYRGELGFLNCDDIGIKLLFLCHRMPVFASWNCATRYPIYVCARTVNTIQETNEAHSLYGQHPAERRMKSRNCFLRSVNPAE